MSIAIDQALCGYFEGKRQALGLPVPCDHRIEALNCRLFESGTKSLAFRWLLQDFPARFLPVQRQQLLIQTNIDRQLPSGDDRAPYLAELVVSSCSRSAKEVRPLPEIGTSAPVIFTGECCSPLCGATIASIRPTTEVARSAGLFLPSTGRVSSCARASACSRERKSVTSSSMVSAERALKDISPEARPNRFLIRWLISGAEYLSAALPRAAPAPVLPVHLFAERAAVADDRARRKPRPCCAGYPVRSAFE